MAGGAAAAIRTSGPAPFCLSALSPAPPPQGAFIRRALSPRSSPPSPGRDGKRPQAPPLPPHRGRGDGERAEDALGPDLEGGDPPLDAGRDLAAEGVDHLGTGATALAGSVVPHLESAASSAPNASVSRAWKAADSSAAIRSRLAWALICRQQQAGSPHTAIRRPPSRRRPHPGQLVATRWSVGAAPVPVVPLAGVGPRSILGVRVRPSHGQRALSSPPASQDGALLAAAGYDSCRCGPGHLGFWPPRRWCCALAAAPSVPPGCCRCGRDRPRVPVALPWRPTPL